MSETDTTQVSNAVKRLSDLAIDLDGRGFSSRVLGTNGKLRMWVQNRTVSHLSDAVYAAPADDGSWWLWWSWEDQLAPIDDVESAAAKIAYVLTPA